MEPDTPWSCGFLYLEHANLVQYSNAELIVVEAGQHPSAGRNLISVQSVRDLAHSIQPVR